MSDAHATLTPAKWLRVRDLYGLALDEPLERRAMFVRLSSAGDDELEAEVVSLLAAHEQAGSFLGEPAVAALDMSESRPAAAELETGAVLNKRFEIRRFIDRGGMGSVYEAWDGELEEIVALKTILPEIASAPSIIQFFKDEVKQARQIAHPNICRVHDLFCHEQVDGEHLWFLTMEMLEGRTLERWLREDGPITREEALPLVGQIVSGLSAAHELGVVHRDLKSGNIILVPSKSKVLKAVITDFGLAARATAAFDEASTSRWQGSPAYVAPEQWHDGVVGPAADQFSLGVVMCEMITGKRPVLTWPGGGSLRAVALPVDARLKGRWETVIDRCLQVRPENRFRSVAAMMEILDPSRKRRIVVRRVLAGVCTALLVMAVFLGTTAMTRKPSISNLRQLTPTMDLSTSPSLSRDGKVIAYMSDRSGSGSSDIWVQHLPDGAPVRITDDVAGDEDPSISPDGRYVVFASTREHGGIYLASAEGGPAKRLAGEGRNPRFSPDGQSVLYWTGDDNKIRAAGRLFVIHLADGRSTRLASDFADARDAIWNSDGRHIMFKGCAAGHSSIPACWDWWVTTVDGEWPRATGALAVLSRQKLSLSGELGGWYGNTILFTANAGREEHLWELNLSPTTMRVDNRPTELTPGDARERILSSSLAEGNLLAITDLSSAVHVWKIGRADRTGVVRLAKVTEDAGMDADPHISPNGRWLTFARGASADRQLWIRDLSSNREEVFPAEGSDKFYPITDDTGMSLLYEVWKDGVPSILMKKSAASVPVTLCDACRAPTGWFDGDAGLIVSDAAISSVGMYRPKTGVVQTILSKPGSSIAEATWSPQSEFFLFTVSSSRGKSQVFAARFPKDATEPDRHWIQITPPSESVLRPRWSGDGKTIYYLSKRDNFWCLWAQSFSSASNSVSGEPVALQHFHSYRFSPGSIGPHSLNMSVAGDTIYLNIAEMTGTIWIGTLDRPFLQSISQHF